MKRTLLAAALVGVLATVGTATAARLITGKNIKDGSVGYVDISKTAKTKLKGAKGPAGPAGPQGGQGAQGPAGTNGADGSARAFGLVNNSTGTPQMQKSKGGPTVRRSGNGIFCIKVAGIDPSSNVLIAQIDASGSLSGLVTTATGSGAVVSSQCNSDEFQVLAYDANNGLGRNDVSFNFAIP